MWGIKDEWNYYINKKAQVVIQKEVDCSDNSQWSIEVKETWTDQAGTMTLNVVNSKEEAIAFCKEYGLPYEIGSLTQ